VNVGELQRKLSRWAEQDKGHKFYDLYHLLYDKDWLRLAHDYVAQNAGSKTAGCDGINMALFDEQLEINLQKLQEDLKSETFTPYPVRRVYIPKSNGKVRPLGIPSIRDRIVQEALRMVLEPIYEADFSQYSFGFRPNRSTLDALSYIRWSSTERKKYFWVIEGDISSYFDTICHKRLLKLMAHRIKDGKILRLTQKFLQAGVMEGKLFKDTKEGTPQGGIVSPLLANIYLHELDKYMEKTFLSLSSRQKDKRRAQKLGNCTYTRYADDFVVLCNGGKAQAEGIREELFQFLKEHLKLTLSKEKTKITHVNDGYTFLGYLIWRRRGQEGMTTKLLIPDTAIKKIRDKITEALDRTSTNDSAVARIVATNQVISGWCHYYQYAADASRTFNWLGWHAHWKMAHWLGAKYRIDSMPEIMKKLHDGKQFTVNGCLFKSTERYRSASYRKRFFPPNPYTMETVAITRELSQLEGHWTGYERRKGMADVRTLVIQRDNLTCQQCGAKVTYSTAQVDHRRPYRRFKLPVNANRMDNLQTLCIPCHNKKTKSDRQVESRMR
jgi:group II intron reverse transcriptase/maturase